VKQLEAVPDHPLFDHLSPKQVWSIQHSFKPFSAEPKAGENAPYAFAGELPRVCIWDGAIRSGKTVASLIAWAFYVVDAPRGGELVVIGRTRESLARNVFGPLQDQAIMGELAQYVHYTSGAPTATMFGRTVWVLGASDARSENVLRGMTVAGAYVDEATLVAEEFWTQLLGRMSIAGAQLFCTTNPDGPRHWFKTSVIDRARKLGYKRYHFTRYDNTALIRDNPRYFEQIALEFTGLWYQRFVEGLWVAAEGAVYGMFDFDANVISRTQLPQIERVFGVGVDYGTVHQTRGYALGLGKVWVSREDGTVRWDLNGRRANPNRFRLEPRLFTLKEWAPGTGTVSEHADSLGQWVESWPGDWPKPDFYAVDSAAATFKIQLYRQGYSNAINAHKAVLSGIQTVSSLAKLRQLYVVKEDNPQLLDAIPRYMWDAKAADRGNTEPVKKDDDEVDAWRYSIYTFRRYWRDYVGTTQVHADELDDNDEDF
jgi:hypothetical protein